MGRIFACTDLHGRKDLLDKIMDFLEADDKVYFLGDAADRGPDGWEMIKTILNDERFVYIMGNHEDMLIKAAKRWFKWHAMGNDYNLLRANGGAKTFADMSQDPEAEEIIRKLEQLPTYAAYFSNALGYNIFLAHAGFTPWADDEDGLPIVPDDKDLIWDRSHYMDDFKEEELYLNSIVVHGHTPIPYIMDDLRLPNPGDLIDAGPLWYANRHKVCLDCAAFATGATFLLNLDTFECVTIRDEN